MESAIKRDAVFAHSEDVVAREIQGVLVIVPITSGIGDMEEELFTLNDTGKSIWDMLDGHRTVNDIAKELASEYETEGGELTVDVLGLLEELAARRLVVVV